MNKIKIQILCTIVLLMSVISIDAMFTSFARRARVGGYSGTSRVRVNTQPYFWQRWYSSWFSNKTSEATNTPTSLSTITPQTKAPSVMPLPTSQEVSTVEGQTPTFGWTSSIPGTKAFKEKQMSELLDRMEKNGVTQENIDQYQKLRRQYMDFAGKDYNPIATKSSLLVNEAIKNLTYINPNDNGLFPENRILEQLYTLGVHVSFAESDQIIKKSGWDIRAKQVANMVDTIKESEDLTIKDIGYIASLIVSTYRMFQLFGVDITPYFARPLNIKDMQWLSDEFLEIQDKTNKNLWTGISFNGKKEYKNARADIYPISYFNQNVAGSSVHRNHSDSDSTSQSSRPDYSQYPGGYSKRLVSTDNPVPYFVQNLKKTNFGETFLAKAKQAGFFSPITQLTVLSSYAVPSSARNTLIKKLNLSHDASYETIKDAYYEFSRKARSQDVTGPLYSTLETEINPAWNIYKDELAKLAKEKNEQLATE